MFLISLFFCFKKYRTNFLNFPGVKTFFIKARKSDIMSQFMSTPMSVSPLMQTRNRLSSCNNQSKPRPHYLHMVTNTSNYRMKASSLPSILDSDNEGDAVDEKDDANKSPSSTASYGKKKSRNRPWRYLQRQRTTEEMSPIERDERSVFISDVKPVVSSPCEDCNGINKVIFQLFKCIFFFG